MANSKMIKTLNFWDQLPQPFSCLAPMSQFTDSAMRLVLARHCKPDVIFTEFISTAGLCSPKGRNKLLPDLRYDTIERPIVAQFFGRDPEQFYHSAKLATELEYDGVDINLGCPDRSVLRQGAGSSLIREPSLVAEIVTAAKEGAQGRPVSVKTRLGYSECTIENWIPHLVSMKPAAITLHGRTRKQKYLGKADWTAISRAAQIAHSAQIPLIGNGDITNWTEAREKAEIYGVNGIMIGRAAIGNPWVFDKTLIQKPLSLEYILSIIIEHAEIYESHHSGIKNFANVRKHLKNYVSAFLGAKALRSELVQAENAQHVRKIIENFLSHTPASEAP
jgi:nifR3 family TIM-barrel protein